MATQFFGKDRGAAITTITTGTSTTSKPIEVAVNDAVNLTKGEVVIALQEITDFILNQRTTPFK
jgi:hypothetical protein